MAKATIKTYNRHLIAPYQPREKAAGIIASAKKLAHLLLGGPRRAILVQHRRKMLKEVLWLISEADGKYATRYRSAEVVRLARQSPGCNVAIRHEHVYPRAQVTAEILRREAEFRRFPGRLDKFLDETVGCVVTAREHRELLDGAVGWNRYENVPVLDMSTTPPRRLRIRRSSP
jgi:hypothetical protein